MRRHGSASCRRWGERIAFVWVAIAACTVGVLPGCEKVFRRFRSGDMHTIAEASSDSTEAPSGGDAQVELLLPHRIDVLPFTKPASFDEDPIPDGIEVVLRPLDAFGDQTKAIGRFRFELYEFRKASTDHRGRRLGLWRVDLTGKRAQVQHWDRITRTYRFRLLWTGETPKPGKYTLEVTYVSPWGQRLSTVYMLEARVPRAKIKERIEKRQKRFRLF